MSEQPTGPQQPYQQPSIIIQNTAMAGASAYAGGLLPRKRHSIAVHIVLLLFTAGIGNLIYWWWIASENKKRGY